MTAIEITKDKNWHRIWIETDSALVVLTFKNSKTIVTWRLRNYRLHNAMLLFNIYIGKEIKSPTLLLTLVAL
jgi:hypothetical protein